MCIWRHCWQDTLNPSDRIQCERSTPRKRANGPAKRRRSVSGDRQRAGRHHAHLNHRQALCAIDVVAAVRYDLRIRDAVEGVGAAIGLAYLYGSRIGIMSLVVFCTVMMVMAAMRRIAAVMMMDILTRFTGKQRQQLYRMVHSTFVEPEPHKRHDVGHKQQRRSYPASNLHGYYLISVMYGMRA